MRGAVTAFLADKDQQSLSKDWNAKLKRELTSLADFCDSRKLAALYDLNLQTLEEHRATWTGGALTRKKRQERVRQFFLYCTKHKWTTDNPAASLSTIKTKSVPTIPLDRDQFAAVLEAVERYDLKAPDGAWRRKRAKAMILLLRWSGLRISDAARLPRAKLNDRGALHLRTSKTGQPVYVLLPPHVAKALRELPNDNKRFFFWNGTSDMETPGKRWWATLKSIFESAGIPKGHPHMLRDTFAVELLLSGVTIDLVSVLLGHSSIKVTEKHYSPWVRARQEQLEESVKKAWDKA